MQRPARDLGHVRSLGCLLTWPIPSYAPNVFRLVVEVTSATRSDGLGPKAECYAEAGVPVCIVAEREHDEVLLYRDPVGGEYAASERFKRGRSVPVPESVGVALDLSVDTLLDGD
ncbi:Uma2 family endonuclease [Streptomyces sp. NBC_00386]|uniref:Uma2 family endonuclease n=1 Tax=Streptomyces sp. NBC_00386 TaxID=2975734 RepID=UPI002E250AE8